MTNFPFKAADAESMPATSPDAVMFHDSYSFGTVVRNNRDILAKSEFAHVLDDTRIHMRGYPGLWHFCHPFKGKVDETVLFGVSHPRAGDPRYDWYQRGKDDVYYGFKVADADGDGTEPIAPIVATPAKIVATPETSPIPISTFEQPQGQP